jgi:SAM-dependent methyltransferase
LSTDSERIEREQRFWDTAFGGSGFEQRSQRRFYSVADRAFEAYGRRASALAEGAEVLEYGCGPGSLGFDLAEMGANVIGIDISSVAIERARAETSQCGLDDRLRFEVMDAEALDFAGGSFDLACGTGILHHLDLSKALPELARALKPDGAGIFVEPMGHNPLIEAYRRRTPSARTPDEHPLKLADFELAEESFGKVGRQFFSLLSLAAVPLRDSRLFPRALRLLESGDEALFRFVPAARKHAWLVLLELGEPRQPDQAGPGRA